MKKTYYNLGQCITFPLVYFRSTDVEQKNYKRLLWSVPDEWLYILSIWWEIYIIDKSIKDKNKIERIFIPVLNDLLNYLFNNVVPTDKALAHHFAAAYTELLSDNMLMKKFLFWKNKVNNLVKITCKTIKVNKEPNPLKRSLLN